MINEKHNMLAVCLQNSDANIDEIQDDLNLMASLKYFSKHRGI